jgi:imidazolonepropionase
MTDLSIVPHGTVLIRNGVIEDVGPARRVENLAGAKKAREIDATGRVVMPAFVDADMALVVPAPDTAQGLRVTSRQRIQARAAVVASEWARYGCLSVGARTPWATDMKNIGKVLRTHHGLQSKPLRIRSIFSPAISAADGDQFWESAAESFIDALTSKWLPVVRQKKLASILELTVDEPPASLDTSLLRAAAIAAAALGFAIRLRSVARLGQAHLELALAAGAIAIVAPNDCYHSFIGPLAAMGCVRVIPASEGFDDSVNAARHMRTAIDEGAAIALSSSYRTKETSSCNMQFLLHLAVGRLGMTVEEAITASTWNGACSLRLSHVTGSLEPGKKADLLLLDVPDYRELPRRAGHHDVSLAMRAGQVVFRNSPLMQD